MTKANTAKLIALLGVAVVMGYLLGVTCLWQSRPDDQPGSSTGPQTTMRPESRLSPAVIPLPRQSIAQPAPGSGSQALGVQEQAFLDHPDEMTELRTVLSWRLWDLRRAELQRCGAGTKRTLVCWYRFQVELLPEAATPELRVHSGQPLRCVSDDFTGTPQPDVAAEIACIGRTVGAIDGVFLSNTVAEALGKYSGPLDVEILVKPTIEIKR